MNEEGKVLLKGFTFSNSIDGAETLLASIQKFSNNPDEFLIGMEVTGYY